MKTITSIAKMQEFSRQTRSGGLRVGFVPTMGYLHDGHLDLVRRARSLADITVVSIFVNPTQFDRADDLAAYPMDLKTDESVLAYEGVNVLFLPNAEDVYPSGASTWVTVEGLDHSLCGAHRPGHFRGVTTVVSSLFHMVQPDLAVFGEKDYQQLQIIRQMTRDQHFPVEIVAAPTVREADGLAMSSRNARLSEAQRAVAPVIHAGLSAAAESFRAGERSSDALKSVASERIECEGGPAIDYLELVDGRTLQPVAKADNNSVLAVAALLGDVRLIDNILFSRYAGAPEGAAGDAGSSQGDSYNA